MIERSTLRPGTRVRLSSSSHELTLRADTGTIIRPDEWDGYWLVRLDKAALFSDGVGEPEELMEIVQDEDNLVVLGQKPD